MRGKALAAVLLAAASIALGRGPARAEGDLAAKVAQARTAADHEAIARDFEKQAKAFEAAAERHRGVADEYSSGRYGDHSARDHARALAADLDRAAKEAAGLARLHRDMAKAATSK
jgi:hypothetical protein